MSTKKPPAHSNYSRLSQCFYGQLCQGRGVCHLQGKALKAQESNCWRYASQRDGKAEVDPSCPPYY